MQVPGGGLSENKDCSGMVGVFLEKPNQTTAT